jgi:hypothetical protein
MNGAYETPLMTGPQLSISWPTFSPDGLSIAYAKSGRIYMLSGVDGDGDCNANGLPDMCDTPGRDNPVGPLCSYACFPPHGVAGTCGQSADCDGNRVPDSCQLETGDENKNGVLDTCEGPTVQFELASSSGSESATTASFVVSLSEELLEAVTVKYATAGVTANAGGDYKSKSGTLTFAAGQTSRTITVPVVNDTALEPDETFTVTLSDPQGAGAKIGANGTHTYTIINDDNGGVIKFGALAYTVSEAGPAAKVTVLRTGTNIGAIGVDIVTSNGTASAGADYTAVDAGIDWPSGNATTTTVLVPIVNDLYDEPNETFKVKLLEPTGGAVLGTPSEATVTITDNDPSPTVQFAATASSGVEASGAAAFDVVLSAPALQTVTVDFTTVDGTAKSSADDYRSFSGTLTFDPGETKRTLLVQVTADDVKEPNETFSMVLSKPTGGPVLGAKARHTCTILNDDPSGMILLNGAAFSVGEAGPSALITVSRSGGSSGAVGVSYATADGTAKTAGDYTPAKGTLSWASGDTEEKTIEVPIEDDALDEFNETFSFRISSPTGGAILGPTSTATVTVVDDDDPPAVRFDLAESGGAESTTPAAIAVSLSAKSAKTVTVGYTTVKDTAVPVGDYTTKAGTLTFAPGKTGATISVPIVNNTTPEEDERFSVTLANPVNATLGSPDAHVYTIRDEDLHGAIRLSAAAYSVAEGGVVTIKVQRVGGKSGEVSAHVTVAGVSARGGDDYSVGIQSTTLVWGENDLAPQSFTVHTFNDTLDETNETISVTLSDPTGGAELGAPSAATVTITDNDPAPTVRFGAATSVWAEDYSAPKPIAVVLSAASSHEIRVRYATAKGTAGDADFAAESGELVFAPGETSTSIDIHVHGESIVEPDETFTVALSSPVNALLGTPSKHTRTILNDDPGGAIVWVPVAFTTTEGGSGYAVTLYRVGGSGGEISIGYTTVDGTAKAGSDYTATAGVALWPDGDSTEKSFTVPILDDGLDEADETFGIKLSAPTGGASYQGPANATVTIVDDDPMPEVHFGAAASGGTESTTPAVIEVVLSAASSRTVTVKYSTVKGTAVPATDFTTKTGTLTFTPGQTIRTISVPIVNNATHEDPESFTVTLTSPVNATLVDPSAHVYTIEDDDAGGLAADAGPTIVR